MPQANPTGNSNSERLENVTFPQARIDINDNFEALQTLNSGNSEPTTKAAFMQWLDTSSDPAVLKIRNSTNQSWIPVGSLSSSLFKSLGITDIANGGTGKDNKDDAIAALLPAQSGNQGKSLVTNGSVLSWALSSVFSTTTFDYTGETQSWAEPTSGNLAIIFLWGGGGSGATGNNGPGDAGGGGGGCCFGIFPLSTFSFPVTISIGMGGTVPGNDSDGNNGGDSTFATTSDSYYMKANGGEGGREESRGGYGGQIFDLGYENMGNGGVIGGFSGGNGGTETNAGDDTVFGGGGGGGGWDSADAHSGGNIIIRGGYSVMGGNGGRGGGHNGNTTYQNAEAGTVPGGGGGGRAEQTAGAGAHGQCKIYVI